MGNQSSLNASRQSQKSPRQTADKSVVVNITRSKVVAADDYRSGRVPGKGRSSKPAKPRRAERPPRVAGALAGDDADVETLGLTFATCRRIFQHLTLRDVYSCMLVCKEWRSLIDSCAFWRAFVHSHYDMTPVSPPRQSVVHKWCYRQCLKDLTEGRCPPSDSDTDTIKSQGSDRTKSRDSQALFNPVPDLWRCGVLVPYAMIPTDGSLAMYHSFIHGMHWLELLREKLWEFELADCVTVCLFAWNYSRLPNASEVLGLFHAHPKVIKMTPAQKEMTQQELSMYYGLLSTRYQGKRFQMKFYSWLVERLGERALLFDCDSDVVVPTPSFILTQVAPGWIGGIIYAF